jgi:hypothetical protein
VDEDVGVDLMFLDAFPLNVNLAAIFQRRQISLARTTQPR